MESETTLCPRCGAYWQCDCTDRISLTEQGEAAAAKFIQEIWKDRHPDAVAALPDVVGQIRAKRMTQEEAEDFFDQRDRQRGVR